MGMMSGNGALTKIALSFVAITITAMMCAGCGGAQNLVQSEAANWAAFTKVVEGPLGAGIQSLPAPVRERHCYRVILATSGVTAPQLRFHGEIDADSVGFPIMPIEMRGGAPSNGAVAVYGFCSQGTGTVQLQTNMPAAGHGALYEAAFVNLSPTHGRDVDAVQQWLAERQRQAAAREAERREAERQAAMERFAQTLDRELQPELQAIMRRQGRYTGDVLQEVRSGTEMSESLLLEPGQCYLFGVLPHANTQVRPAVLFARIRNATERNDVDRAVLYSVCTAPSGPVQEVTFNVEARTAPNAPTPPAFAVSVATRQPTSAERRAADQEWVANDPEARIQ